MFWHEAATARLFEDQKYGQWGLVLVSPSEAEELTREFEDDRPEDFREGDLVVGKFLGDSDLLIARCDRGAADYGHVLVALPIDPREDWYEAAKDFVHFLEEYERAEGAKFWEER